MKKYMEEFVSRAMEEYKEKFIEDFMSKSMEEFMPMLMAGFLETKPIKPTSTEEQKKPKFGVPQDPPLS
jgi:hypothetical protein